MRALSAARGRIHRGRRRGRVGSIALATAACALLLSSCQFASSFQYVSHRAPDGVDLYFKVPARWSTFDTKDVIEAQNGKLGPTQLKQISSGEWIETMSARPGITAKESGGLGQRYPGAVVEVQQLGGQTRDSLNFSAMRSEILGVDPLTATSGFQVLNYNEFTAPGGIHGVKMIVNIDGGQVTTFGQITAVDADTNWIFSVAVSCHASCWGQNAGAIRDVLNSWTLKEQSP